MTTAPGRPRAAVASLPAYRPGRSAKAAMLEHDLDPLVVQAVKLASNELPFPPLPSAAAAIAAAIDGASLYADHRADALRSALAASVGLTADHVTVGCGSVGLLQQLALTYLDPGDPVVFARPSFEAYPVYASLMGAHAVEVPLRRQTIDLTALASAVDERTKLILIANPNNPTGTAVGTDDVRAFLAGVPESCIVVLDEAYREFVDSPDVSDTVGLLAEFPHLVVLRTFSKAHALAALRVGYALAHPHVIAQLDRTLVPFAVNGLAQHAAIASLAASDEMRERVGVVTAERARVTAGLRDLGWSVPDSQANFVWLPGGAGAVALATGLERHGVVTRPFADVGVRVSIGSADANDHFLAAFETLASDIDPAHWVLPTGELAKRVHHALGELDRAGRRLAGHAAAPADPSRLTDADPATGEQWDTGQVWAHLAEFGSYWLDQLRTIVDAPVGDGRNADPVAVGASDARGPAVAFGRTKADPGRIAAIADGRRRPTAEHLRTVRRDIARFAAELAQLDAADWERTGVHPTLGEMDLWRFLDEFAIGHYHEHADQLDRLRHG